MRLWRTLLFLSGGTLLVLLLLPDGAKPPPPADSEADRPRITSSIKEKPPDPGETPPALPAAPDRGAPGLAPTAEPAEPRTAARAPEAPVAAPPPPWAVRLAADFSREKAISQFERVRARHAAILGGYEPTVIRETNLSRGRSEQFIVQIAVDSRTAARALCKRLRAQGGACIVARNPE